MTVYKIDAIRGSDSNDGISAPWRSPSKLTTLTPLAGDVIAFASDSIFESESRITLPQHTNGTRAQPILWTSYDPPGVTGGKPRFRLRKVIRASAWVWDDTEDDGVPRGWYFDSGSNGNILSYLTLGGEDALSGEPGFPYPQQDNSFQADGTKIYVYAPPDKNPSAYYGEVAFGHASKFFTMSNYGNFVIVENLCVENGGGLLYVYVASGDRTYIVRNIEAHDAAAAIRFGPDEGTNCHMEVLDSYFDESQHAHVHCGSPAGAGYVRIARNRFVRGGRARPVGQIYNQMNVGLFEVCQNEFSGARRNGPNYPQDGCAIYAEIGSRNVFAWGNWIHHCHAAIQDSSGYASTYMGNLITECHNAIQVTDAPDADAIDFKFIGNTCVVGHDIAPNYGQPTDFTGIRIYKPEGSGTTVDIRNNILVSAKPSAYKAAILVPESEWSGTIDSNCVLGWPAVAAKEFSGGAGADPTPTNTIEEDPMLSAAYRLMEGSPCIGAGAYIQGARHFGGARLRSPGADIGAFRYEAQRTSVPARPVGV